MKTIKRYGKEEYEELKILLDKANLSLKTAKGLSKELEEELEKAFDKCNIFNPKKASTMREYYKKLNKSPEEIKEYEQLMEEEKLYQDRFIAKDLKEVIFGCLPENKTVNAVAIQKIINKKEEYPTNSLPFVFIRHLDSSKGFPTSIPTLLVTEEKLECSKSNSYRITFVSIVYDEIIKEYVRHSWRVIFKETDILVSKGQDIEFDEEESLM